MTHRELIEHQIGEALATETHASALSQKLFHPNGLFGQLAATEEERRVVAQSALFREAQRRLSDLQRQEATAFAQAVAQAPPALAGNALMLQVLPAGVDCAPRGAD
jgi:hypothetical protein